MRSFVPISALVRSAGLMALTTCWLITQGCGPPDTGPRQELGQDAEGIAFVSNETCAECHTEQFNEWQGSHHDWSMRHADDASVLGDFDNATLEHFGVTSRFFKKDGRYYVNTEGSDGQASDFEISYTFGVEPLQQYLIEFPGGRLQSLTIAWDIAGKRWFHLYPDERITADDPLHWTRRFQTWNMMCAECHSTNLRKGYDGESDSYRTTWSEINVSCQACHGPGESHVAWAREIPEGVTPDAGEHGLVVGFEAADPRYEVDNCARCHSRRHQVSPNDELGRPLMDDFQVAPLREGLYHADGQILDEVYVYGSFVQSRMYHSGVRCSDCHNSHSLKLFRPGNDLCIRCHQTSPPQDFPDLNSKDYDTPAHHFHPPGSAGAQCVECHMRARTYMTVDPRRDHSFRVPRPDLTVKVGVPNACNDCHQDETAQWAADTLRKWYPKSSAPKPHFAETLAAGRAGRPEALPPLVQLANDAEQPAIVRATALELLRGYPPNELAVVGPLTRDAEPLVRAGVASVLQNLPPDALRASLAPLLNDPLRSVRVEAARVVGSLPGRMLGSLDPEAFGAAFAEFEQAQLAHGDMPGSHLNLGAVYAAQGDAAQAEQQYLAAIRLEPGFLPARFNLSTLYNQLGRNEDAEKILRETVKLAPQEGEAHYSLGLILAEQGKIAEAAGSLEKAAEFLPGRARVRYNYALALQHLGDLPRAEIQLLQAHQTDPADPDIVNAVISFYLQRRDARKALPYVERLVELVPDAAGPKQLLMQLREQLKR
ncbi:MAG: tetratricopeptide repeat protein [Acidobacteria bacterium]|nr:tetratricopeptide repeat protein [Acidobacteriota bacterium]